MELGINQLSLHLRSTADIDVAALSSAGFSTAPATIALSERIRVAFTAAGQPDCILGHADLADRGHSTLSAWNDAAQSIVDQAGDASTSSFLVRHLHSPQLPRTIQIRVRAGKASEWLAHPLLFTRMHRCATKVFGSEAAFFHVLGPDTVVASFADITPDVIAAEFPRLGLEIKEGYFFPSLRCHQGFPVDSSLLSPAALGAEEKAPLVC